VNDSHTSPLVPFLRDPSRQLAHAASTVAHALVHLLPLALLTSVIVATFLLTRLVLARLREQRLARGARLLELAVPPELNIDGALLLWLSLHDLLRPRVARLVGGQPQLAWEIAADHAGTRFRLWAPVAIPPGLVERALASAWPGITTTQLAAAGTGKDAAAIREEAA
jgi:hypothetical protein